MLTLTPVLTVSYEAKISFLFLSVMEFAVGFLANAFIVSGLLLLDAIQLAGFQQMKDPLNRNYQAILTLWMIVNQVSLWLAACLCLLYCSKTVRFSHTFPLHVASCVSRRFLQMLLVALFFSCICTALCLWDFFSRSPSTVTSILHMNNTEFNLQIAKLNFFYSFIFCNVGSVPPSLAFLVSSGVLVISLGSHMRTMKSHTRVSSDPSLEAHIRAIVFLVSFLGFYVVSFCAALISVPLLVLWHNKGGRDGLYRDDGSLSFWTCSHPNIRQCQAEEGCRDHAILASKQVKGEKSPQGPSQDTLISH